MHELFEALETACLRLIVIDCQRYFFQEEKADKEGVYLIAGIHMKAKLQ